MNRYTNQIEELLYTDEAIPTITITRLDDVRPFSGPRVRIKIRRLLGFHDTPQSADWIGIVSTFYGFIMAFDDEDFDAMIAELN